VFASNAEPEASGATKVESDALIGAEAGTLAEPGSDDVWTASFASTLSTGSVAGNELGGADVAAAVSGTYVDFDSLAAAFAGASVVAADAAAAWSIAFSDTVTTAGGRVVTSAGGAGDKDGSIRSEGTAGFNKLDPGPETDNKSERNCCSSAVPICGLDVAG